MHGNLFAAIMCTTFGKAKICYIENEILLNGSVASFCVTFLSGIPANRYCLTDENVVDASHLKREYSKRKMCRSFITGAFR